MSNLNKDVGKVVETLLQMGARKATKFVSEKYVINATRKTYQRKIDKRATAIDVILKIGKPNFQEKMFIEKCKKAGESFPIKKIQLKFFK